MKRTIIAMAALIQCSIICAAPFLYFKNISPFAITIIAENNQQITLRPHDAAWPFSVEHEPVIIVAHLGNEIVITDTFMRESFAEVQWNIQVYKPIKRIVIQRFDRHE